MNDVTHAPEQTALTVVDRARTALKTAEREAALIALAANSANITVITNAAGYQECHAARMVLKRERIEIERVGEASRGDAVKFSKAVIEEQKRLVAIIGTEESRLQVLQDAHDEKVAAEKAAKAKAEADRIAAITQRIDWMIGNPIEVIGKPASEIKEMLDALVSVPITEAIYAEFMPRAESAKASAVAKLTAMHAGQVANETEAARLKAEREAFETEQRQTREKAAREHAETLERTNRENERRAEEQRAIDAEKAEVARREQAVRDEEARQAKVKAELAEAARVAEEQWTDRTRASIAEIADAPHAPSMMFMSSSEMERELDALKKQCTAQEWIPQFGHLLPDAIAAFEKACAEFATIIEAKRNEEAEQADRLARAETQRQADQAAAAERERVADAERKAVRAQEVAKAREVYSTPKAALRGIFAVCGDESYSDAEARAEIALIAEGHQTPAKAAA